MKQDGKPRSLTLAGEIELARVRLSALAAKLKSAAQNARLARRRHKEAKKAARRAKKECKLVEAEFEDMKRLLEHAELRLAKQRERSLSCRNGKASVNRKQPPGTSTTRRKSPPVLSRAGDRSRRVRALISANDTPQIKSAF